MPLSNDTGAQLDLLFNITWDPQAGQPPVISVLDSGLGRVDILLQGGRTESDYMPDVNLPGGDIGSEDFHLNGSVPWTDKNGSAQCDAFCKHHSECTGWTYVRPGRVTIAPVSRTV